MAAVLPSRRRGIALGLLADRVLGEPSTALHPVARFGQAMQAVERHLYADSRAAGAWHTAAGVAMAGAAGVSVRSGATANPVASTMGGAVTGYVAVAARALGDAAMAVGEALAVDDLDRARARLSALVGRDPSHLDEKEMARAVVESVAENTVDAVVAPVFWALLAGSPGVLVHRAVNTMDAMVGYHSTRYERYGWAAARLDDLAAWLPARATAALVASCRPSSAGLVWRTVRRDAPAHPSPNSGVAEAAFAAVLGLRLGGENRYHDRVELRLPLGDGRPPEVADIRRSVRLSNDVTAALAGALLVVDVARVLRRARRRGP